MEDKNNIVLNRKEKRFELYVKDHTATLYYEVYQPSVWLLTHTLVPDPLKGQGIGSRLVKQVLTYCQENQIRIIPECSFVVAYLQKHPQWKSLLFEQE
ncbi:GNAT family N-acetyltransferase [Thermophagus sp. OGC60D27]|uniref:GNAT family N-acetyltransferase n=1 Tax=Thermophagus sp. OGC60D27 TaxID=3458415 RepID=UPI004037AF4F